MKIGFNPQSIVGLDGMPLVGRVTFYVHDSDVKATVFSMQGDTFVESQNPQLLNNAGRLEDTVFFDAAIIDVSIQQYIGETGHMTPDSPDSDFAPFDHFEIGFQIPAGESVPKVGTIEELKGADVSTGVVLVTGYYQDGDSPARFYLWDESSSNTEDGGYVIASDNEDAGRWIMLWGFATIPSILYGIKAGTEEANISSFLSYPEIIGTHLLCTAPVPRFLPGTYSSNTTFSTTKKVAFDKGAKFTNAIFSLPCCDVEPGNDYVADFIFSRQAVAESGWFRTLKRFYTCKAQTLHIGADNFADKTIDAVTTVNGGTITGNGRIAPTYTVDGYLHFSGCKILANGFLAAEGERVKFSGTAWNDDWWTSIALASRFNFIALSGTYTGAFVDFRTINSNRVDIDDFSNADIFLKAAICDVGSNALLDKRLFCRGRSFSSMTASVFTEIHDATIDGACELSATTLKLYNIKAQTSFKFNGNELRVYDGCDLKLAAGCTLSVLQAYDSKITKDTALDVFPSISAYRCEWKVSMAAATDNETNTTAAAFEHCLVHDSVFLHKHLSFFSCTITNCQIGVYPYKENNAYKMNFVMEGCSHISSAPVVFNKIDDLGDVCNNIEPTIRIVNNTFSGNAIGVRAPFYSSLTNRTLFFKGGALSGFEYSGNGGACPSDSAQSNHSQYFVATTSSDTEIPNSGYVSPVEIRAFPTFCQRSALTTINFGRYTQEWLLSNQEDIVALEKIGKHIVHSVQLTPWATDEYNDYFSLRYYDTSDPNKTIVIM